MNMFQERIRAWVEALRSGKYQQGKGALQPQPGFYCCLGVACEVYREKTGKGRWVQALPTGSNPAQDFFDESDTPIAVGSRGGAQSGVMTAGVSEWLFGTDAQMNPQIINDCGTTLASINDGGASFAHIADVIEKQFLPTPQKEDV